MADLAEAVTTLPGVRAVRVEKGEFVAEAVRETLIALMTAPQDVARIAFEQATDICRVDWPQRAERSDVGYNLLSVSLNQRLRAIVTTDENAPVPSVHTTWPVATWWEREVWDLFWHTGDATLIDGVPNGLVELTVDRSRQAVKIQTGSLAVYAFVILIGAVQLIAIFLVSR